MNGGYLFYAGLLVEHIAPTLYLSLHIKSMHGQEIYDGGWVYAQWDKGRPYEWWRCDMTPCHIEHVPKELRALALLLT